MRKIIAVLVIAMLIFHFTMTFNRHSFSLSQKTFTLPKITFNPGFFVPKTILPSTSVSSPAIHIRASFFNFLR